MTKILLILFICTGIFAKANVIANKVSTDTTKKMDTLNIMISEANYIYYYNEPLQPDASNFGIVDHIQVNTLIAIYIEEAKRKDHQLMIFLKIQQQSSLNENSKKAMDYIKQWNYKKVNLKEVEKELIRITERVSKNS